MMHFDPLPSVCDKHVLREEVPAVEKVSSLVSTVTMLAVRQIRESFPKTILPAGISFWVSFADRYFYSNGLELI